MCMLHAYDMHLISHRELFYLFLLYYSIIVIVKAKVGQYEGSCSEKVLATKGGRL